MFSTRLQGGKAFAGEQKNRELKKLLLKSKSLDKKNKIRINPKNLIEKAANNTNKTNSEKYNIAAITIKKSIENENHKKCYGFHRLIKVKEDVKRRERTDINTDSRKK